MKIPISMLSMQSSTTAGELAKQPREKISKIFSLQSYSLIWLDLNIDEANDDYRQTIEELTDIVHMVYIFKSMNECVEFLIDNDEQQIFLIISVESGQPWIDVLHPFQSLIRIYFINRSTTLLQQQQRWTRRWSKIQGVYSDLRLIYEDLKIAVKQIDHDSIPISRVTSDDKLSKIDFDQLEPSFMYTKLMMTTFLMMKHNNQSIEDLISYFYENRLINSHRKLLMDEFEKDYTPSKAIWWYTRESFVYRMINQALRSLQVETIVAMRFFICDLHRQIHQLHKQQYSRFNEESLVVYRGQRIHSDDWKLLRYKVGRLLSFNSFFTASRTRDGPFLFARSATEMKQMLGIILILRINPKLKSNLFADIQDLSYFKNENEIIFSMHSVFRIEKVEKLTGHDRLFEISLDLTDDDDKHLQTLTDAIEQETTGLTCIRRIADLFIHLEQPSILEKLYGDILKQSAEDEEAIECNYYLALVKNLQGHRTKATQHLRKAFLLAQKYLAQDNPKLRAVYSAIAVTYDRMGEHSSSIFFHEKVIDLQRRIISDNDPAVASMYNNLALAYEAIGRDSKALMFFEKALEIQQKRLSYDGPYLAVCYSNIGFMYANLRKHTQASVFNQKANQIQALTPLFNYSQLVKSYENIAAVYQHLGRYKKAFAFYEKALEIEKRNYAKIQSQMPDLYNSIGLACDYLAEYSKALGYYDHALDIQQETLRSNDPRLATTYYNIASVNFKTGEYATALSLFQRVLDIQNKIRPTNSVRLGLLYSYMASIYCFMGQNLMASKFSEKTLIMEEQSLHEHHPLCAIIYRNISLMYKYMKDYAKALLFCEEALQIQHKHLHVNHPDLASSYVLSGILQYHIGRHAEALNFLLRSLEINQLCLPSTHPEIRLALQWIETIKKDMSDVV